MAKRDSGTGAGKCNKCGIEEKSTILGAKHRRCPGQEGQPIRPKDKKLPIDNRGVWG